MNVEATRSKKLLGAPGIATGSKDATKGSCGVTTRNKKLLGTKLGSFRPEIVIPPLLTSSTYSDRLGHTPSRANCICNLGDLGGIKKVLLGKNRKCLTSPTDLCNIWLQRRCPLQVLNPYIFNSLNLSHNNPSKPSTNLSKQH